MLRRGSDENEDSAARAWVIRLVSGAADEKLLADFKAWVAGSPARQQAFDRERRLYVTAGKHETVLRAHASRQRYWFGGAVAAGLAAVLTFTVSPDLLFPPDYVVPAGPAESFTLADGSVATVDGGSAINVSIEGGRRDIELVRGRAFFAVAHDPAHPFVVSAHGGTATAVGTAYAVSMDHDAVRVDVAEGVVRVVASGRTHMVRAGQAVAGAGPPQLLARDALTWRDGEIIASDRPFEDLAAELDRYIEGRVIIFGDVAARRVGGVFRAANAEEGLRALAETQGASVRRVGPLLIIS